MLKLLAGLAILSLAAPYAQAEMKWNGGAGVRTTHKVFNDGLETKNTANKDTSKSTEKRWEIRGSLGVTGTGENVDWTIGVRTASSQTSEWVRVTSGTDQSFNLELANARLHYDLGGGDFGVTVGRQKAAFMYDGVVQTFFDKDVRWDGLGWNWKSGAIGFNASQYVLGATDRGTALQPSTFTKTEATDASPNTRSHFAMLYSFQPTFELKISDEVKAAFGLGYHIWQGTGGQHGGAVANSLGYTNNIHGGTAGTIGDVTPVTLDNARQWQFVTDWSLPSKLRLTAEFVRNKTTRYGPPGNISNRNAKRDALGLSLFYGVAKKAHDFTVGYSYSEKGVASVVGTFSNGDALPDNRSHMFDAKYMLADAVALGGKLQYHKEIGRVDGRGESLRLISGGEKRLQKERRIEVYTSVAF